MTVEARPPRGREPRHRLHQSVLRPGRRRALYGWRRHVSCLHSRPSSGQTCDQRAAAGWRRSANRDLRLSRKARSRRPRDQRAAAGWQPSASRARRPWSMPKIQQSGSRRLRLAQKDSLQSDGNGNSARARPLGSRAWLADPQTLPGDCCQLSLRESRRAPLHDDYPEMHLPF